MISQKSLKEKILEASRHILVVDGHGGLSMRKIAAVVGCKASSIYHHFESKDKIVHTLIDEGYKLQYQRTLDSIEGIEDPLVRIKKCSLAFLDFGLDQPDYYYIMYTLVTKEMERYPKENYRNTTKTIMIIIDDLSTAQKDKLISTLENPHILANTGLAILHGFISLIITNRYHHKLDIQEIKELIIQQTLNLYGIH